ncbi:MAG: DUF4920 domain-containing protein [Candidatus Kapabacteria bacterium]|nr:DUF4920 domain-containing protein [Candidatus Kapabacteria bacterium]
MKKIVSMLVVSFVLVAFAPQEPAPAKKGQEYGGGVHSATVLSLKRAVADRRFNTRIAVSAHVREVCKKKGCWMILADSGTSVRVTFKEYAFFMPKDLGGKRVVVEGVMSEEVLSEADARHYAEDAGRSAKEIERIVGDKRELTFEATGVRVR